ncbi:Gfo/Idh/MocA family protein [Haloquadratum walsbyi]|uniref:Putative dehydrogenase related protein n=1 Tax=Haloquadratum walsbyi J07HQW2 TaxID=1238425 RepID=U1MY26_9EURY|nr:Gfo/Idh/MocA family oxidoreductase [Haloquadratum walsbyi]ERG95369.1 MAG: putative dehydrogenase related protein [Haloquadratum walsbyi J07HQW2]
MVRETLSAIETHTYQSEATGTIRYAVVGLGWWATEMALPALAAASNATVTTLVAEDGINPDTQKLARQYDVDILTTSERFRAVETNVSGQYTLENSSSPPSPETNSDSEANDNTIDTSAYDAVYIATPNAAHLPYAKIAAAQEKAVLCEKPIEASVERGNQLRTCCQRANVPLMTAYRVQMHPLVRYARKLIDQGDIGDVTLVQSHHTQPLLEMSPDTNQWRLDPAQTGYGTSIMDLGVYTVNTARFLLNANPITVSAVTIADTPGFEAVPDDRASAILSFPDGVQLIANTTQRGQHGSGIKIIGTQGSIELRGVFRGQCSLTVAAGDIEGTFEHTQFTLHDEVTAVFEYFADCLLTDTPVSPNGAEGIVDLSVMRAMYADGDESTNRMVSYPEFV